jgi:hypothetical protein
MDKQWRKPRHPIFQQKCCLNATRCFHEIFDASYGRCRCSTLASAHASRRRALRQPGSPAYPNSSVRKAAAAKALLATLWRGAARKWSRDQKLFDVGQR